MAREDSLVEGGSRASSEELPLPSRERPCLVRCNFASAELAEWVEAAGLRLSSTAWEAGKLAVCCHFVPVGPRAEASLQYLAVYKH